MRNKNMSSLVYAVIGTILADDVLNYIEESEKDLDEEEEL